MNRRHIGINRTLQADPNLNMKTIPLSFLCALSFSALLCGGRVTAAESAAPFVHPDTAADNSWSGSWVGVSASSTSNQWSAFRKPFTVAKVPARAIARIAVDSKYWLWLNGELVVREGGLKRGPTPRDTYFDEVELAPHLKTGTNTLAILLWHFGKEGFSHKSSGQSALLFQLDAGRVKLRSDGSWQARIHPAFGDTAKPYPNYRLAESNIRFDATKDIVGWEQPVYDASAWPNTVMFGKPPCAPWNRLALRPVPQWKDYGLKAFANAAELPKVSDGSVVKARLPYNAQVTPYLKIEAAAGQLIKIQTDDYMGGGEASVRAEYVTRDGVQEFECPGWMNGNVVHYEMPAGIKLLDLRYRESGFDTEFTGTFACDDDFLNRLRTKAVRTLYITMRDNYMDCPDRERGLWWGDAVNELGEAFYALDRRADTLTRKCMLDLVGWQKTNGVLFAPIPAGNWTDDLPLQMLASIGRTGFGTYGLYSGDTKTLRAVYPAVKRYMEIWQMQTNGLVVPIPGAWPWGDWGDNVDMTVLYNAWYHIGLQGMEQMALATGQKKDLPWIAARKAAIEGAFNQTFWNGKEYRSLDHKGKTDDRANALAVVAGLAKPEQFPALLEVFRQQEHASPYMEKYVLEALCLMDQPAFAQDRIKRRYAKMVEHPDYTTLWEGWGIGKDGFGGGTINHAWSGGPLTIMSQYFAGIAPTSPGFATYHVLPQMGALRRIEASVAGVKGDIKVQLQNAADAFSLKLTSPAGTIATVGIPVTAGESIAEVRANNKVVWQAGDGKNSLTGLRFVEATPRFIVFEVKPGKWTFTASKQPSALPVSAAVVDVTQFGAVPDDGKDDTEAFLAAFRMVQTSGTKLIEVPKGRYNLCADGNPSRRDALFPMTRTDGLTIRGQGAELMMSGTAGIFTFTECQNITIEGLTVDWERPGFSQGTVIAAEPKQFDVQIEKGFPVQGGEPVGAFMSYDPVTRLPDGKGLDVYDGVERTELLSPQVLRVHLQRNIPVKVGTLLVLRHQVYGPGVIRFHRCADVRVNDVTVFTVPGMGLTAGVSTNISLKRFNVRLRPDSGRLMSATADATHFAGCKGTVTLEDCTFEGMGDDGVNVKSGLYLTVLQRLDDSTVLCQRNDLPDAGDLMEMSHPDTLRPFSTSGVKSANVEPGTNNQARVTFASPLPVELRAGDLLANASRVAKLRMRHCTVRSNRARGVLCQTRDAVIEDCTFRNCTGPGVLVLTETVHFYESIGTRNVAVRNNLFENCNLGAATAEGALAVLAWLKDWAYPSQPGVHRDVRFEGNHIIGSANSGIFAVGVDGLTIRSNLIQQACLKPDNENRRHAIRVMDCARVVIDGNDIDPKKQGAGMEEAVRVTGVDATKP